MSSVISKNQLDTNELLILKQAVRSEGKNIGIAYLLWFLLGGAGAHRFYLRRKGSAITLLLLTLISSLLSIILIGYIGILVMLVWVFIDAFLIPGMVRSHNSKIEQSVMHDLVRSHRR